MVKKNVILIVACIALGCALIYFQFYRKKPTTQQEGFVTTGGMQNLGSVEYDLIEQPPYALDSHELLGAPDFADLVDSGDHAQAIQAVGQSARPLERLQTLSDSYIPTKRDHLTDR